MKAHIFCVLPSVLSSPLETGMIGRARELDALEVMVHDLHELSPDSHHKIDDSPYGGGPGMVLRVDVVAHAFEKVFEVEAHKVKEHLPVVLFTPQGEEFNQKMARFLASQETIAFLCGRYEGVDERIREHIASYEVSLGDFVIAGGEIAAAVVLEAVVRLLPGVVGNKESLVEESFTDGLLEYPQYTRPASFKGWKVPEVLLRGNHAEIERWRREESLKRTRQRRPDLFSRRECD
ncbi:MAG: tRNA (guanosine(37)-N1)-methyltransferase TrmD [Actinomycetota bacterium]|nr:tRNA (guanosine(37)-N1)-methyltransferase TrmD [Actinomycetota bacterium]